MNFKCMLYIWVFSPLTMHSTFCVLQQTSGVTLKTMECLYKSLLYKLSSAWKFIFVTVPATVIWEWWKMMEMLISMITKMTVITANFSLLTGTIWSYLSSCKHMSSAHHPPYEWIDSLTKVFIWICKPTYIRKKRTKTLKIHIWRGEQRSITYKLPPLPLKQCITITNFPATVLWNWCQDNVFNLFINLNHPLTEKNNNNWMCGS